MVTVLTPASIWAQLGSFSFLLSAFFGDLLLIRVCLIMAYIWLMTAACNGFPSWPHIKDGPAGEPGFISVDGIVWAGLNLFFHGAALYRMLRDERRISLSQPEHESLWLFFYRRSGMGRLEFQTSMKRARLERFKAGEVVLDADGSHSTLMLLVEGLATYRMDDLKGKEVKGDTPLLSGCSFDIGLLNVLGVYLGFEKQPNEVVTVTARTDCLVCFWDLEDLNFLATQCSPAVSAFWRNFALCQVGLEWYGRAYPDRPQVNGRGKPEPVGIKDGSARSSDFTDPLEAYEDPRPTLRGVLRWLPTTLSPFIPSGMRHNAMPRAGAMARNRLIALGATNRPAGTLLAKEPRAMRNQSRIILDALGAAGGLELTPSPQPQAGMAAGDEGKPADGMV